MTDAEIIKALEFCGKCECNDEKTQQECALINMSFCRNYLRKQSLDLINRQKAEIERLKKGWKADVIETESYYMEAIEKVKAEAIKEFAERLKDHSRKMQSSDFSGEFWDRAVLVSAIDNLVKEMAGDAE